jgi:hypothetical protein
MSDTDLELLARYTRHHAEDAFAELVRRHVDHVQIPKKGCPEGIGKRGLSGFDNSHELKVLAPALKALHEAAPVIHFKQGSATGAPSPFIRHFGVHPI